MPWSPVRRRMYLSLRRAFEEIRLCALSRATTCCCADLMTLHTSCAGDRMRLARSANKPLLLEEFGATRGYVQPASSGRDKVFKRCKLLPAMQVCQQRGLWQTCTLLPAGASAAIAPQTPQTSLAVQPNQDVMTDIGGALLQHLVSRQCICAGGHNGVGGARNLWRRQLLRLQLHPGAPSLLVSVWSALCLRAASERQSFP